METNEHTEAGNKIIVAPELLNQYMSGGSDSKSGDITPLTIKNMMRLNADGLPEPTGISMSAGEIVALSGDYFTEPGWGLELTLPQKTRASYSDAIEIEIADKETEAFKKAYGAVVSPEVTTALIKKIYQIENDFEKNPSTFNQYISQVKYWWHVPHYFKSLNLNYAHFTPWSIRAYIVGHHQAIQQAKYAYELRQMANATSDKQPTISPETLAIIEKIKQTQPSPPSAETLNELLLEYADRYQTLAVGMELAVQHYYSDSYASGHMSRLGIMRKLLNDKFGFFGQTLVNSMHNEENEFGVQVKHDQLDNGFDLPEQMENTDAGGDGTFDDPSNNANANDLINGMSSSLGDLYETAINGANVTPDQYAGAEFLPYIDETVEQYQPMFVYSPKDHQIYYRTDIAVAKRMSPEAYRQLEQAPDRFEDYQKLTTFKAFTLFLRLRVASIFSFIWSAPHKASEDIPRVEALEDASKLSSSYSAMHQNGIQLESQTSARETVDEAPRQEKQTQHCACDQASPVTEVSTVQLRPAH